MIRKRSSRITSTMLIVLSIVVISACDQVPTGPTAPSRVADMSIAKAAHAETALRSTGNLNGSGGDMPAYYDAKLFTINFRELATNAETALLAHNGAINTIYTSDQMLPGNKMFVSVLDAIQGDGFNPLWREVGVVFNEGVTPHQFFADDEVIGAASGPHPEITLVPTDEVYRCSVVGHK